MRFTTCSWWRTAAMARMTRPARCAPGCWESPSASRHSGAAGTGWRSPSRSPESDRADEARSPDEVVASRQASSRLQAALAKLDIDQRAVVVMHDLHGIPVPEIATTLDVPLNTVYSRLRLGRAKIAAALRGEP